MSIFLSSIAVRVLLQFKCCPNKNGLQFSVVYQFEINPITDFFMSTIGEIGPTNNRK
jgi:hypothetical protein